MAILTYYFYELLENPYPYFINNIFYMLSINFALFGFIP